MQLPHIQFYGRDWLSDSSLRMCSASTRGIWMDMLALMSQAEPYGYLVAGGSTIDERQLARASGETVEDIKKALSELEYFKVFSRDAAGRIYSRRLVRDYEKIITDQKNGRKGGNPKLKKKPVLEAISHNPDTIHHIPYTNKDNGGVNPDVNQGVEDDLPYDAKEYEQ